MPPVIVTRHIPEYESEASGGRTGLAATGRRP